MTDYAAALDGEAAMLVAVMGISRADLQILWAGSARDESSEEGWMLGTTEFRVLHQLALA